MPRLAKIRSLPYLIVLLIEAGCTTLQSASVTAKLVADKLETIPLGTPYEAVKASLPKAATEGTSLTTARYFIHAFLMINPRAKGFSDLTLYRQWPHGLPLELGDNDSVTALKVSDNSFQSGNIFVLFDRDRKYLGYCAYSSTRGSKDSKARLASEKKAYLDMGLEEECERAEKSSELIKAGGEALNRLPKLPLSANRAPNSKTIAQ